MNASLRTIAMAAAVTLTVAPAALAQQQAASPAQTPRVEQRNERPERTNSVQLAVDRRRVRSDASLELEALRHRDDSTQVFQYSRPVFRMFGDYTLKEGEAVREVIVVSGNVRIEGRVEDDVMVTAGTVTIASTARVDGSLAVFAGNAVIERGAVIRRAVAVFGGTLDAPSDLQVSGEQIVVGTPQIADSVQALVPWITRGLLFGRLIVPGLGWVWTVVLASFLIGLLLNHLFVRQSTLCADVIVQRPMSVFLVGLLTLLVAPIVLTILAATVIGIIAIPFAILAFIFAGVIGKVGVARAIGRGMIAEGEDAGRATAARSFTIGAMVMTFAYMFPVIGLLTWATAGVFGLGAGTMTMMARLRKERPAPPPVAPIVAPATPPPTTPDVPGFGSPRPSESFAAEAPPVASYRSMEAPVAEAPSAFPDEVPPAAVPLSHTLPPGSVPPPGGASSAAAAPPIMGGLASYPRATFFDRVAAMALDLVFVAIIYNIFDRWWWRDDEAFFFFVLAYHIGFWAWKGTTLGGIICNLRVVRTNGENPRFIDALVRGLSGIFSVVALGIGCFWMISDAQRQMWHDKIAGTIVVKLPRELVLA